MSAGSPAPPADAGVDAAALEQAARFVEQEDGALHRLHGWRANLLEGVLALVAAFHLWAAVDIVGAPWLRSLHVAAMLALLFVTMPAAARWRDRVMPWDWAAAFAAIACIAWLLHDWDALADRATEPLTTDILVATTLTLLILEAVRRASGAVMPIVVGAFLAYAFVGPWLPAPWTHRGYDLARLAGHMAMTLEGIFGTPIDVCATLIVLFTIYGAVLARSGAGQFFIDFALALTGRSAAGPGRAVVIGSFLLGGPSGSGVATTVTLGSVAWPLLARAGYAREAAGGLLAAGGLGAILSPPVLGAAAFLIAEFLKVSYLDVIRMAVVPTLLYYLSLFAMVELDARRHGTRGTTRDPAAASGLRAAAAMLRTGGWHFLSLVAVVAFLVAGYSPMLSVVWATGLAVATSAIRRETRLGPRAIVAALADGTRGVLGVAATCAAAGLIVGVVTLTGLGLKFSGIVIDYAGGSLALTALLTGLLVWVVGLAVPVTASYIICAVVAAPALVQAGVSEPAAHMFIFYYAVLSEVSPPTALSPFAAAAITGGDAYRTTLQSWKYTLPAFVTPFLFVLAPHGTGLLLEGGAGQVITATGLAIVTVLVLAVAAQGWLRARLSGLERGTLALAGIALAASVVWTEIAGFALAGGAIAVHLWRTRV
ncbi:MAG: TRAP transporter fused permease subunit [Burkholderiales bacterium]|nr:TRAP transporter fused permease subunit [Burkholderiales bacterium]